MSVVAQVLQLDKIPQPAQFSDFKRAFTPEAVREIYGAIPEIWPDSTDYHRCIAAERDSVSAFYSGTYEPEVVLRAVTRHSLYSERIFLVDPFAYAPSMRAEFNPVLHPEQHRANAVRNTFLWWSLAPWVLEGLVCFVRTPGDFDTDVEREVIEIQREKFETNEKLRAAIDEHARKELEAAGPFDRGIGEHFLLSNSNERLLEMIREYPGESPFKTDNEFLEYIQRRRDEHPYFVERLPGQNREFLLHTSGSSYEMAKRICELGNFHIITDLRSRWLELESEFENAKNNLRNWSPFAKALQAAPLRILNNVPLESALELRSQKRLESLRLFLQKVWRNSREAEEFAEENALNLASELAERVREADIEYKKIDQQLFKWFGAAGAAGVTLLTTGVAGFIPAASTALGTGLAGVAQTTWQRRSFQRQFPAGFFLSVPKSDDRSA
jgi:hypothetical protein